jgi:Xaa-Pro aminopeptidase
MKLDRIEMQAGMEKLLEGFEPDFAFEPPPPLPEAEFAERLRRIRRQAAVEELDAIVLHTDQIGWYHTSNSYLRYVCDWMREGMLIVPTDADKGLQLLSFFSDSVLLPPAGEPLLVEDIWQVGPWGREALDRPGSPIIKAAEGCADILRRFGFEKARIGLVGDKTSRDYFAALGKLLPNCAFSDANAIVDSLQRRRSKAEQARLRAAAQLIDIGLQAAYHVIRPGITDREIYAAFTFAQLARGGETGDGYQIGINRYGTHCGKPYGHIVRPGDLINIYVSNVTYQGYFAQSARMIAVGDLTQEQEAVLEMTTDAVRRAERLIRPGVAMSDLHTAAFTAYTERGYLQDDCTRTMPFNWAAADDGTPRRIPKTDVEDIDWQAQGRRLSHIYPPLKGPHNPNLGHAVGMPKMPLFNVSSHNCDRAEEGMVFVLHAQWLDPLKAGSNIGDCYLVTDEGYECLTCHTALDVHRVSA